MKNVAKCDTWCELQNPANHRVFERKLRPRPSGRGHVCLGVTPKDTPHPPRCGTWRMAPRAVRRGGPKLGLPAYRVGHSTWWATSVVIGAVTRRASRREGPVRPIDRSASRSDRDPRSVGTTR